LLIPFVRVVSNKVDLRHINNFQKIEFSTPNPQMGASRQSI